VDVWASGVILYFLLSGTWPFGSQDDKDKVLFKNASHGLCSHQMESEDWEYISKEAKQFISRLLEVDEEKRYSAADALRDPWLEEHAPRSVEKAPSSLLNNLRSFKARSDFQKTTLRMIAWRMDEQKIHSLRRVFEALDENGDGPLSATEIREGLLKAHSGDIPADLLEIVNGVHFDHSEGEIDFTEFIAAMLDKKVLLQREQCWQAFRVYDKDGDGKISLKELQEVFRCGSVEEAMGPDAVQMLHRSIDTDGDGEIGFEEFLQLMTCKMPTPNLSPRSSSKAS